MKKFVKKALQAFPKLDREHLRSILEDLVEENEGMQQVLCSLSEALIVVNRDHRIMVVNKQAERLLLPLKGSGEYQDYPVWAVVGDHDIAAFIRRTLLHEENSVDHDFTLELQGTHRVLRCNILPLVDEGQIKGSLITLKDVTKKKQQEARLRRAESLASLTTMAAGVAHEIKNPLGSMGIHIQLMKKLLAKEDCPQAETLSRYTDILTEEVDRLNQIVVDYLFAVRPMDTDPAPTDLNQLIREVAEFVRFELEEAGVETDMELEDHLPRLELDDRFIKQALLNIIKNAIAAMEDSGRRLLTLSTRLHGDEVFLVISDTGGGIPSDIQQKIFEPYFTTKDFGSGLGLTLVYKIVKEHRGDVQISSREGEGTTFTLVFPLPQGEQKLLSWESEEEVSS